MNKKIELKIEYASILVESLYQYMYLSSHQTYNKYSDLYHFTTENLNGCFNKFDFKNKDVLTVCGSGDQALNAILLGAKSVDMFDINELSEMLFKLKKAAVKALSREEYIDYFYFSHSFFTEVEKRESNVMNIKSYWKISPYLDNDARMFWDHLYFQNTGFEIAESSLFCTDVDQEEVIIEANTYLQKDQYYKLKNCIDNCQVKFISSDLKKLKHKLKDNYDLIFLSNIAQYVKASLDNNKEYDLEQLRMFKKTVLGLSAYLKDHGVMAIAYLYNYLEQEGYNSKDWATIYKEMERITVFPEDQFSYVEFPGISAIKRNINWKTNSDIVDAVMIYKK